MESQCKTPIEGIFGFFTEPDGTVVPYYQCNCSEEAILARMGLAAEYQQQYEDPQVLEGTLRRLAALDLRLSGGSGVPRGVKVENLGMRVNKIGTLKRRLL